MSAFLCSPYHIGRLARWLADHRGGSGDAAEYATVLGMANIESIIARYPDTEEGNHGKRGDGACEAFIGTGREAYLHACIRDALDTPADDLTPADICKAADCLEYQSCEYAGYRASDAFMLLNWIRKEAIEQAFGEAYRDAAWELKPATVTGLRAEFRAVWDPADKWGTTMGYLFDIAGELHRRGELIPDSWGYAPGLYVPTGEAAYPGVRRARADSLRKFGNVVCRLSTRIIARGESY